MVGGLLIVLASGPRPKIPSVPRVLKNPLSCSVHPNTPSNCGNLGLILAFKNLTLLRSVDNLLLIARCFFFFIQKVKFRPIWIFGSATRPILSLKTHPFRLLSPPKFYENGQVSLGLQPLPPQCHFMTFSSHFKD